jgi:hypothetical protein
MRGARAVRYGNFVTPSPPLRGEGVKRRADLTPDYPPKRDARPFARGLSGKQHRQVLRALQLDLFVHPGIGRGQELGDHVVANGDRIALLAAGLEKIRGGNPVAPGRRQQHHIDAVAVAGEVHHLELGCA